MYSQPNPSREFLRLHAVHRSGAVRSFPVRELAPGRSGPFGSALTSRARRSLRLAQATPGGGDAAARREWPALVQALATVYNRRHPEDRIVVVRTSSCTLVPTARRREDAVACAPVERVGLAPLTP